VCSFGGDEMLNCVQVPLTLPPTPPPANNREIPCDLFICEWDTLKWVIGVAALAGSAGLVYLMVLYFFGRPAKNMVDHSYLYVRT